MRIDAGESSASERLRTRLPGEPGLWIFILGDMTVFAIFFAAFTYSRAQDVAAFSLSQARLDKDLGVLDTLLLLTSSWLVATAVKLTRGGEMLWASRCVGAATACGLGFGVSKILEYGEKARSGITLTTNDFFMYYFVLTGIHLLHVLIGIGLLGFLHQHLRSAVPSSYNRILVEGGACYWHMVDLLWIVLFPLFYLLK